jgi:hypothetical protein
MIEFIVEGTPRSVQGSARGLSEWRAVVKQAALATVDRNERYDVVNVSAQIVHFCFEWGDTAGDLDNIAKPILDATAGIGFFNDSQVRQLLLRRTDLVHDDVTMINGASPLLATRLQTALEERANRPPGFIYVSVATDIDHGSLP